MFFFFACIFLIYSHRPRCFNLFFTEFYCTFRRFYHLLRDKDPRKNKWLRFSDTSVTPVRHHPSDNMFQQSLSINLQEIMSNLKVATEFLNWNIDGIPCQDFNLKELGRWLCVEERLISFMFIAVIVRSTNPAP